MGRGDKKTAKGKRTIGSFGVSRSKDAIKEKIKRNASTKPKPDDAKEVAAPKTKKAPAKKKAEA